MADRVFPAVLGYTGGPIGDFMSAVDFLLARYDVAADLSARFQFGELKAVTILPGTPGLAVPYCGPEMVELWFSKKVEFNPGLSTLEFQDGCDMCGRSSYKIVGVEESPKEVKVGDRWEMMPGTPRSPGQGVLLRQRDVGQYELFEYGNGFSMCTGRVKDYITDKGWTNIQFWDYGEIID